MGPSCAGKSTLTKNLYKELHTIDGTWKTIDLDAVEESIELLIQTTNTFLLNNHNIIIDTNTYENNMEAKFQGDPIITKIIVSAPLEILLQRDEERTKKLNRNQEKAYWSRHFVIESFKESHSWQADLHIDSSLHSSQENCSIILKHLKK